MKIVLKLDIRKLKYYLVIALIFSGSLYAQPTISSFAPLKGRTGTTVTITGTNFSAVASDNIVYFGGARTSVLSATTTSLSATVPSGATFQPISITTNSLTAYSSQPFNVTFGDGIISLDESSFNTKVDFPSGDSPLDMCSSDFDGDGKLDFATTDFSGNIISISRNTSSAGALTFAPRINYTTGAQPHGVAAGDFDGDGKRDLVVVNYGASSIAIMRNTSSPRSIAFALSNYYVVGSQPRQVAIADFDLDGKPDLAITNYASNTVSILRNTTSGGVISFVVVASLATASNPFSIAAGDLDADGQVDIAVTNYLSNTVSVLRNSSTGGTISFASKTDFGSGVNPRSIAIADIDADGKPDLLVANNANSSISVLKSSCTPGTIAFEAKIDYASGVGPAYIAAIDLDGDGRVDLACANMVSNTISVFKNSGSTGTISFLSKVDYASGDSPRTIIPIDIDGDAKPELATSNNFSYSLSVLKNKMPDALSPSPPIITSMNPSSALPGTTVTISGENFTGAISVSFGETYASNFTAVSPTIITAVVGLGASGDVSVTTPNGTGSLPGFSFITPSAPSITSISPNTATTYSTVLISGGNFYGITAVSFAGVPATSFTVLSPTAISAKVANGASGTVSVSGAFGSGNLGGFTFIQPLAISSFTPHAGHIGSTITLNGTAFSHIASDNIVYFGPVKANVTSASTTQLSVTVPIGANYQLISVITNGLIAYSDQPFNVTFDGGGVAFTATTFAAKKDFPGVENSYGIATGDLNGDGKPDIILADADANSIGVYRNTSTLSNVTFALPQKNITGANARDVAVEDLDGDGKLDVIVANKGANSVSLLLNISTNGNISFANKVDYPAGSAPNSICITDIDKDGKADLVVVNGASTISVLRNISGIGVLSFEPKMDFITGQTPFCVRAMDLNADGLPELVTANFNSNTISILKNIGSPGNILFDPKIEIAGGVGSGHHIAFGDLDGDGKPDIAVGHAIAGGPSVLRNISSGGNIEFDVKIEYPISAYSRNMNIGDLDGDGKPEMTTTTWNNNTIAVFKNTSPVGNISLDASVSYAAGTRSWASCIVDLDGDKKVDLVVTNAGKISVLRNQINDPSINTFSPTSAGAGTSITITGSNFTNATQVSFGGTPARSFTVVNPTTVTAVVDTGTSGSVSIATEYGLATNTGFTFIPPPVINSFTPDSAGTGIIVAIDGVNLTGVNAVTFGGVPAASFTVVNENTIIASIATGASGAVTITSPGGTATVGGFVFVATPTITAFSPSTATTGMQITISGKDLATANLVTFGSTNAASFSIVDQNTISAVVGNGSTGVISVRTPGGTATSPGFFYTIPPVPVVITFRPDTGTTGTMVTINGSNFIGVTKISFGGTNALSYSVTDTNTIEAIVGGGSTGAVAITNGGGTDSATGFVFNIPSVPQITSFTPLTAVKGDVITITGTDFLGASAVSFGGTVASLYTVIDANTIQATVARGSSGIVSVTTPGGVSIKSGFVFRYPSITSFSPLSGPLGTVVTISGTGFSAIPSNNFVYFGSVRAIVLTASSNSLTVIVPAGFSNQPVWVTANGLTASSSHTFNVTFPSGFDAFSTTSFASPLDLPSGPDPYSLVSADFDGDGKPDFAAPMLTGGYVSIYRNTSTTNDISFADRINYTTGTHPWSIDIGDVNSDGKPDLVVANSLSLTITVLVNISSPGNISFLSPGDVGLGPLNQFWCLKVGDLDNDGRPDVVAGSASPGSYSPNTLSIYKNESTEGIRFGPILEYDLIGSARDVAIGDLNYDGNNEVVAISANTVYVYPNNSTIGNIALGTPIYLATSLPATHVTMNDIDGDGKIDLVVSNFSNSSFSAFYVSVFRNTSTAGSISFGPREDINIPYLAGGNEVSDFDGDGKPDFATYYEGGIYFLKNRSTIGSISFAPPVFYNVGRFLFDVAISDLNLDGTPDISFVNASDLYGSISILKNTVAKPKVIPAGINPITGDVNTRLTIDSSVQTYNGKPYVQRHYDIEPQIDPANSTARVTLYFTQQEFDNFNAHPAHGLSLPTAPNDITGIANVRIHQNHGFSATSTPGTYSDSTVIIDPQDDDIKWNIGALRWEITFDVYGFSGFFVTSADAISLPLKLIPFSGKVEKDHVVLEWIATDDVNTSYFEVERNTDGNTFSSIKHTKASGRRRNLYEHLDYADANKVYYYRLKIVDFDAKFFYSKVIIVKTGNQHVLFTVYPNPAGKYLTVRHPLSMHKGEIKLIDLMGRTVKRVDVQPNVLESGLAIKGVNAGAYILVWSDGNNRLSVKVIVE